MVLQLNLYLFLIQRKSPVFLMFKNKMHYRLIDGSDVLTSGTSIIPNGGYGNKLGHVNTFWPAPSTARVSRRAFHLSMAEYATYKVCVIGRVTNLNCQLNIGWIFKCTELVGRPVGGGAAHRPPPSLPLFLWDYGAIIFIRKK